jgi:catechol 2,3-dioxygenase-like lactoylglutathione lyase family enzyme
MPATSHSSPTARPRCISRNETSSAAFEWASRSTLWRRGHIAFRTDDIEAFKRRLDEKGVPYADYGGFAMNGWQQIFFQDPEGNVIEVHQAPA